MKKLSLLLLLSVLAVSCNRPSGNQPNQPVETNNQTTAGDYLVISEWGVQFRRPAGMDDLKYAPYNTSEGDTKAFITDRLINFDKSTGGQSCVASEAPIGVLTRVRDFSYFQQQGHFIPGNVKIGDYYYYFTGPQAACSENKQAQDLQNKQLTDLGSTVLLTLTSSQPVPSDWQTYNNDTVGYSLRYPATWEVLRNSIAADTEVDISLRDKKYDGAMEWPGLRIEQRDTPGEFVEADQAKVFDTHGTKVAIARITFAEQGKTLYASCALYDDPYIITTCNQILSTFRVTK
jgi:hypothetical protein